MVLMLKSMVYGTVVILDNKLFIFFGSYLSFKYCTNPAIHVLYNLTFSFLLGEVPSREENTSRCKVSVWMFLAIQN